MAHSKSAKKRVVQNEKCRIHNKDLKSATRTAIKKVAQSVEEKDLEKAKENLRIATKAIDKATKKNIFHKNNSARQKSHLAKLVNTIGAKE